MKEIKFRAWNGQFMEYGGFSIHANGGIQPLGGLTKVKKDSPAMQYTGLKDKNGEEIYAGDILRCKYIKTKEVEILAVKDSPGQFSLYNPNCCEVCKENEGCIAYLSDWVHFPSVWSVKKIGNIHENPELLEG